MKILLVYPEIPPTFWSFKDALSFVSKKSAEPPLGLITVAGMLPKEWELRLIDMNVAKLNDADITWADYVFLSGMSVQFNSFKEVVRRSNRLGTKVVAGGPLCTTQYKEILGVDHFVLDEAEITLPVFLKDLEEGIPKQVYRSGNFPDISLASVPRWDLLNKKVYASMSIQYSRGCPYDCEFCSITMLNGRKPRAKSKEQFINELNILYEQGWKGGISVVDDNIIGDKRKLKNDLLPALIKWSEERKHPFYFITEVSINLADDTELVDMMVQAGFNSVFVGIETPNDASLEECGKSHNLKRDLIESINELQKRGLMVSGGFIVGFDNDTSDIFDRQIQFIQKSGIVSAMVGLLNAPVGTKLFKRLQNENRLLENFSGNNMDGSINFIPKMKYSELIKGYSKLLASIYSQKEYYARIKEFLSRYNMPKWQNITPSFAEIKAFFKLLWKLGIVEKGKIYFWKLFVFSLWKYPKKFTVAMTFAVYGFHFRRVAQGI
ncbi:hypothetical protein ASZ90_003365 [hydrocarbon metagenome]|uniref:Radical SAM core domain-containing protein n=1 Tax=hydrocarbon metagenome TaxID=938273 RepID=A0A0W8G121_9ZZZZ